MRLLPALLVVAVVGLPALALGQPPQPPPGFEPMTEVPASEQIPAFLLVAIAYMFVWAVLFGYVTSLVKRLRKVEQDLQELEQRRT